MLNLLRKIIDVAAGYSKEDLVNLRSVASKEFPAFVPIMDEYVRFAETADSEVAPKGTRLGSKPAPRGSADSMHLFDMLRDKRLFPLNSDLADFAGRVLPGWGTIASTRCLVATSHRESSNTLRQGIKEPGRA